MRDDSLRMVDPANGDDAVCRLVLAMQVFLHPSATEGIRPAIAREALSAYSPATDARLLRNNPSPAAA